MKRVIESGGEIITQFDDPREAMNAGMRFCYSIEPNSPRNAETDEIVPSLVVEHTAGHYPMLGNGPHALPWYWGKDEEQAKRIAARKNASMGLSDDDVEWIKATSVCATIALISPVRRRARRLRNVRDEG